MEIPKGARVHPTAFRSADGLFLRVEHTGIEHVIDNELDREFLKCDPSIPYPAPTGVEAFDKVLLERFEDENGEAYFLLPENYVTMSQALNDAIGDTPNRESFESGQQLFGDLGRALAQMIRDSGKAPTALRYQDILFLRDEPGIKLLPPLAVVDAVTHNTRTNLTASLLNSCIEAVSNADQQQSLIPAFKEFITTFSW